jgi:hypothetical protein
MLRQNQFCPICKFGTTASQTGYLCDAQWRIDVLVDRRARIYSKAERRQPVWAQRTGTQSDRRKDGHNIDAAAKKLRRHLARCGSGYSKRRMPKKRADAWRSSATSAEP